MARGAGRGRGRGAAAGRVRIWVLGSLLGTAVVAVPDRGPRVVSFSDTHGPSALDLVGVVVLVASWLPVAALLWAQRRTWWRSTGRVACVLGAVGLALLVVTVSRDLGPSWIAGVVVLVAAQAAALHGITSGTGRPGRPA